VRRLAAEEATETTISRDGAGDFVGFAYRGSRLDDDNRFVG